MKRIPDVGCRSSQGAAGLIAWLEVLANVSAMAFGEDWHSAALGCVVQRREGCVPGRQVRRGEAWAACRSDVYMAVANSHP